MPNEMRGVTNLARSPKPDHSKQKSQICSFLIMTEGEKNIELAEINVVKKESAEVFVRESINP